MSPVALSAEVYGARKDVGSSLQTTDTEACRLVILLFILQTRSPFVARSSLKVQLRNHKETRTFVVLFAVLGIKPKTSHTLGERLTTESQP